MAYVIQVYVQFHASWNESTPFTRLLFLRLDRGAVIYRTRAFDERKSHSGRLDSKLRLLKTLIVCCEIF